MNWHELLDGLDQRRMADLDVFRSHAAQAAPDATLEAQWARAPPEAREAALAHGYARLLHDPLVLRLVEDGSEEGARDIIGKIAPELSTAEGLQALNVPRLLQGAHSEPARARLQASLSFKAARVLSLRVRDCATCACAALLEGKENEGVLPPLPDVKNKGSAAEVAVHQVARLRHAIRSSLLTALVRSVLLAEGPTDTAAA